MLGWEMTGRAGYDLNGQASLSEDVVRVGEFILGRLPANAQLQRRFIHEENFPYASAVWNQVPGGVWKKAGSIPRSSLGHQRRWLLGRRGGQGVASPQGVAAAGGEWPLGMIRLERGEKRACPEVDENCRPRRIYNTEKGVDPMLLMVGIGKK